MTQGPADEPAELDHDPFFDALERYEIARAAWKAAHAAYRAAASAGSPVVSDTCDKTIAAYCDAFAALIEIEPSTKEGLAWFVSTVVDELDEQCADSSDELRIAMVTIANALQKIMPEAYSE